MNERIKELLNQASLYAYEQNPGENSYGRPVDEVKYNQDRDTKFAELIVRECAELCLTHEMADEPFGEKSYRKGRHFHVMIRQHFGVE